MGESSPGTPPSVDRLNSWKEIAAYFDRDVSTVQRWEKKEGMPVHRHLHDRMGSVYALAAELESWARGRDLRTPQENEDNAQSPNSLAPPRRALPRFRTRRRLVLPLAAVAAALAGRGGVTRRAFRCVSIQSRRTDGRVGDAGWVG